MIKLIVLFLSFFSFNIEANSTQRIDLQPINCSPELQKCLVKLLHIDEVRELIIEIQKEGPIFVRTNQHDVSDQFGAYWDPNQRTICIGLRAHESEGEVIGSILFELHNAKENGQFEHLDHLAVIGKIDRESYVRNVEYVEYQNSLKAAAIAKKGIALNVLPRETCLYTYKNFEEHYRMQKIGGHSAVIERNYRDLRSYGK